MILLADSEGPDQTAQLSADHYENTPIQMYRKFHHQNLIIFS